MFRRVVSHFTVYLRRLLHDTPNFAARLVRTLQKKTAGTTLVTFEPVTIQLPLLLRLRFTGGLIAHCYITAPFRLDCSLALIHIYYCAAASLFSLFSLSLSLTARHPFGVHSFVSLYLYLFS